MKSVKSYTCKISGNVEKVNFLNSTLEVLQDLSKFVFEQGKPAWLNQKQLYHDCRNKFPELNSKFLQNMIKQYQIIKGKKLPKKVINPTIYIDYQSFSFQKDLTIKITNYWLRFSKRNFPLFGKKILSKISDFSKIKLIQIYKKNNSLYCKLSYVLEIDDLQKNSNVIGLDVNYKRIVLSNNNFYKINKLAHRKIEHHKHNQMKRNLTNYSKDFIHKLTTKISKDLSNEGVEVLVLEDLRTLRKSASKKLGTTKGKKLNYIINSLPFSMFQNFLTYKCLDLGIKIEKINPAYSSKTCSRCSCQTDTLRPKQNLFICNSCNYQLDADLNASRNICYKYTLANELPMTTALVRREN